MQYSDETHTSFKFENFEMKKLFDEYTAAKRNNLLLKVEYTSVFDYLSLLEYSCRSISKLKRFEKKKVNKINIGFKNIIEYVSFII